MNLNPSPTSFHSTKTPENPCSVLGFCPDLSLSLSVVMWPESSDGVAARSPSEISEVNAVRIGADLVPAARRVVGFFRLVGDCEWLRHKPTIVEAVRRYDELWMPLISDLTVGSKPPLLLPPLDVEWVWFCHTLNPVSYRRYCETRFSKLIGKPAIFDEENEDYAILQCNRIWVKRYPNESFENEIDSDSSEPLCVNENVLIEVEKHRFLHEKFSAPYMSEIVYLIAARLRYKGFLLILQKFRDEVSRLVPTSDILLMWLTHQSYPTVYAEDMNDVWEDMAAKLVANGEAVKKRDAEKTKELWDRNFDQPYEKAGGELAVISDGSSFFDPPFHWPVSDTDVNMVYKSLLPRFVLEVCIFIRLNPKIESAQINSKGRSFLRLGVARSHRKLKLDKLISDFTPELKWQKAWHLYCEFGTQGVVLEYNCHRSRSCFSRSKPVEILVFRWNDLLRAHSLTSARFLGKQVRVVASITPPVQASYLLKCVPDRVTDDSGAMVSDSIQRMNNFRPQEGRWLTRTVLDHAGRECFVVRIRIGKGVFRRGGEVPSLVKREERVTEIREGSWSYVEGSIGKAPAKVVGTVTPKEPPEDWKAAWEFSTGDDLLIRWDSLGSISGLGLRSRNQSSPDSSVRLLTGRRMQYQVKQTEPNQGEEEDSEEGNFVTIVRSTEENPTGKATALIDWKRQAVEFLPEEDAVFVLLISVSILRSVTEMRREDVGKLLVRRRLKEARTGERDWGSVMISGSELPISSSSLYVRPWYLDAGKVMVAVAVEEASPATRYPVMNYANVEGGDSLYKLGLFG